MKKEKNTSLVERPNKTQLKRDMESLREQAAYICELTNKKLSRLELNPGLLDAIDELTRIKKPNARKRHIQFITRQLAEQENLEDIQQILFEYQNPHLQQQKIDRRIDQLSKNILEGDAGITKEALDELLALPQLVDRQMFLQLVRNAQKEFTNSTEKSIKNDETEAENNILDGDFLKLADGKHTKKFKQFLRKLLKHQAQI
jgi:ribosome-associated protein